MKNIFLILCIASASCCGQKKATAPAPVVIQEDSMKIQNPTLGIIPVCINDLIAQFSREAKQNPPRKIYSYNYNGQTVYYVPAICCDFYSDLYNNECKLIGHPDGGFTGKGDGKMTDFGTARKDEVLIWEDKR